jgi:hypothetical protein
MIVSTTMEWQFELWKRGGMVRDFFKNPGNRSLSPCLIRVLGIDLNDNGYKLMAH